MITLKLFRTDNNNALLVLVCVVWFHVDTDSGFFVGEIVFWFDVAHVHEHSLLPVQRYWQPSWLTFFRTDNKHVLVWCRLPRMAEAYVDTIIRCSQDENLGSEVVFWFDVAHAHDHSLLLVERYWQASWLITFTFFKTLAIQSRAGCFINATPSRRQEAVGWAPLVGRPADYLPSGTLGQWLPAPCNGGPNKRAATQEPTKRLRGRLGPRAGIPKRLRPNCQS